MGHHRGILMPVAWLWIILNVSISISDQVQVMKAGGTLYLLNGLSVTNSIACRKLAWYTRGWQKCYCCSNAIVKQWIWFQHIEGVMSASMLMYSRGHISWHSSDFTHKLIIFDLLELCLPMYQRSRPFRDSIYTVLSQIYQRLKLVWLKLTERYLLKVEV